MRGLLVDDDPVYSSILARSLARRGVELDLAADAKEAMQAVRKGGHDFVMLDLKIGRDSGLALIEPMLAVAPTLRILVVTGYASIATAVEAVKRGAENYLPKPVSAAVLLAVLHGHAPEPSDAPPEAMTPIQRVEWEHIAQAMTDASGNVSAAARLLGMHRRSLQRKLAKRPHREPRRE